MRGIEELTTTERRDISLDKKRSMRDCLLCALEDAGREMTPLELARATGLDVYHVSATAIHMRAYFRTRREDGGKRIAGIDRHPHLKAGA